MVRRREVRFGVEQERKSDSAPYIFVFCIGILIGMIIVGIFVEDNVDVDTLGEYMCERHGLEFDYEEHSNLDNAEDMDLKIYCKDPKKYKEIENGYLLQER